MEVSCQDLKCVYRTLLVWPEHTLEFNADLYSRADGGSGDGGDGGGDDGGSDYVACTPGALYSNAQCCATDVGGVADLDCENRKCCFL